MELGGGGELGSPPPAGLDALLGLLHAAVGDDELAVRNVHGHRVHTGIAALLQAAPEVENVTDCVRNAYATGRSSIRSLDPDIGLRDDNQTGGLVVVIQLRPRAVLSRSHSHVAFDDAVLGNEHGLALLDGRVTVDGSRRLGGRRRRSAGGSPRRRCLGRIARQDGDELEDVSVRDLRQLTADKDPAVDNLAAAITVLAHHLGNQLRDRTVGDVRAIVGANPAPFRAVEQVSLAIAQMSGSVGPALRVRYFHITLDDAARFYMNWRGLVLGDTRVRNRLVSRADRRFLRIDRLAAVVATERTHGDERQGNDNDHADSGARRDGECAHERVTHVVSLQALNLTWLAPCQFYEQAFAFSVEVHLCASGWDWR